MGIYRGQFLVGDRIEFYKKEYWIISVQQVGAELVYILMDDSLKVKTVCNLGKDESFKLTRRIVQGNKEVLCNLCPLKNTLESCSNFCDYNYFYRRFYEGSMVSNYSNYYTSYLCIYKCSSKLDNHKIYYSKRNH